MIMHKNDPNTEAGNPPPMEVVEKMGAFIGGYAQSGRFIDGAGLRGSATRTRLVFRNGKCTTQRGPYRGEHELPAATLLLRVRTREEGIGWAERYGARAPFTVRSEHSRIADGVEPRRARG